MTRKFFSLILCAMMVLAVAAIPAPRRWMNVTQPDGRQLTLRSEGNEAFHYFRDAEGFPLLRNAAGAWVYATVPETDYVSLSALLPSTQVAHDAAQRDAAESRFVESLRASKQAERLQKMAVALSDARNATRLPLAAQFQSASAAHRHDAQHDHASNEPQPQQLVPIHPDGPKRGLVLLVQFSDRKLRPEHTKAVFEAMMNQRGYDKNGSKGCVSDYFRDQSYGTFELTFDVVGPITLPKKLGYYGSNDIYGNDEHVGEMIEAACRKANDSVDFKRYDWNGDGQVEQIYVITAGYGENEDNGTNPQWIWPHQWSLSDSDKGGSIVLDGVKINNYATSSELRGSKGSNLTNIGTLCHEFSHCLGLPDFYATNGETDIFGMSYWDIMDVGCYNNGGATPSAYTAYERMFCGWLTPQELTEPCSVQDVAPLTDRPTAYLLRNDAHPDEYFLLANHKQEGWNERTFGNGMMILHVDYDSTAWTDNVVNNERNHPRCTIVPADGKRSESDLHGDLYPYYGRNTAWTDTSTPAATLYHPQANGSKLLGKPVTNIRWENGLLSFDFMGGGQTISAIRSAAETKSTAASSRAYDLWGRRLSTTSSQRGLRIVEGQKQFH